MSIQISGQISEIIKKTENMSLKEKQSFFWFIVEKWGKENVFTYSDTLYSNQMLINLPDWFNISEPINQEKSKKHQLENLKNLQGILPSDFEINEEEFYQ